MSNETETDWWEVTFIATCLLPAPIMVLYMAWRVVFG